MPLLPCGARRAASFYGPLPLVAMRCRRKNLDVRAQMLRGHSAEPQGR